MNVYVYVNEDRHYDTDIKVFATLDAAIVEAEAFLEGYDANEAIYFSFAEPNLRYYREYSCEGDNIVIYEKEIEGSEDASQEGSGQ